MDNTEAAETERGVVERGKCREDAGLTSNASKRGVRIILGRSPSSCCLISSPAFNYTRPVDKWVLDTGCLCSMLRVWTIQTQVEHPAKNQSNVITAGIATVKSDTANVNATNSNALHQKIILGRPQRP